MTAISIFRRALAGTALALLILSAAAPAASARPILYRSAVYSGLSQPLFVTGDGTGRFYVIERAGRIFTASSPGATLTTFLDIRGQVNTTSEGGLLSVAFSPNYATDRLFWVYTTNSAGDTVISRFERNAGNPAVADVASQHVIRQFARPYRNHVGGMMTFGNDGYLYVASGDGGSSGDPGNRAQNKDTLFGKILRLDVVGHTNYVVPADNPFVGVAGDDRVWSYGLRNPWRFSFDSTGTIYIGDVGQNAWEEVDVSSAGGKGLNYGWKRWEGKHVYPPGSASPGTAGYTFPVWEIAHPAGESVTGGYVYEGSRFPGMRGAYYFGDYVYGQVYELRKSGSTWVSSLLADYGGTNSSFGRDDTGELYYTDLTGGGVYALGDATPFSLRLSGADRYAVAVEAAKKTTTNWSVETTHVVIASGDDRAAADPLSASGLTWTYQAPLMLVSAKSTPTSVKNALAQIVAAHGPVTLHIVGGTGSVPAARVAELVAAAGPGGVTAVDRIDGVDRYAIAAAVAARMKAVRPTEFPNRALVANGENPDKFFDALSLSPISAKTGAPILLVRANAVPSATSNAFTSLGITEGWVAGGTGTVSTGVLTTLGIPESNRLWGGDRYSTSVAVAGKAVAAGWLTPETIGLAAAMPDALSGGANVGFRGGILLVVQKTGLPAGTANFIGAQKPLISEVWMLGGTGSATDDVRRDVAVQRD